MAEYIYLSVGLWSLEFSMSNSCAKDVCVELVVVFTVSSESEVAGMAPLMQE